MPWLENLICPSHGDGDSWTETEAYEQEADIAGPWVDGIGCDEETSDLDANRDGEEEGAVVVEAVGYGGDEEDGDEVALEVAGKMRLSQKMVKRKGRKYVRSKSVHRVRRHQCRSICYLRP